MWSNSVPFKCRCGGQAQRACNDVSCPSEAFYCLNCQSAALHSSHQTLPLEEFTQIVYNRHEYASFFDEINELGKQLKANLNNI